MSIKQYQLYCEHCGYKRFSDGSDVQDLVQLKTSDVPGGVPQLDPLAKKTIISGGLHQPGIEKTGVIVKKDIKQPKKFKCPQCGYIIKPRVVQFTESPNETNNADGSKTSSPGSPLPGQFT